MNGNEINDAAMKTYSPSCCAILFAIVMLDLFVVLKSNAQDRAKDSLEYLARTPYSQRSIEPLILLGIGTSKLNLDSAISQVRLAYSLSCAYQDSSQMVTAGRLLGEIYRRKIMIDSAMHYLKLILPVARRHNLKRDLKYGLHTIGVINIAQGRYDQALQAFLESLAFREESGDNVEISICLNNIGLVYYKLNNFDYALKFYNRCLSLKESIENTYDLDRLLINIGLCYGELGNYKEASYFTRRGLQQCGSNCPAEKIVEGYYSLSSIAFKRGEFVSAKDTIAAALKLINLNLGIQSMQSELLLLLGQILTAEHNLSAALKSFDHAEDVARLHGYNRVLMDIYLSKAELFGKKKDYIRALNYHEKYIEFSDSIYGTRLLTNVINIERDFLTRSKLAAIAAQQKSLEGKDRMIRQKNLEITMSLVIASILTMAAILIFRLYRRKREHNIKLEQMVFDRTRMIEEVHFQSQKKLRDETMIAVKRNSELETILANVGALCKIGLRDEADQVCLEKIKALIHKAGAG